MTRTPSATKVDEGDEFYHVRMRSPSRFSTVRIPGWASNVAQSISKDAKVKMGKVNSTYTDRYRNEWIVQAVLIKKKYRSESQAMSLAERITEKIET